MVFSVFHERFSVQRGLTYVAIASVRVSASVLLLDAEREWSLPLQTERGDSSGALVVRTRLVSAGSTNPFDEPLRAEEEAGLSRLPWVWLSREKQGFAGDVAAVERMRDETLKQIGHGVTFKSSQAKGDEKTGALPTNLHVCEFAVVDGQRRVRRRVTTSMGAAAAHALGLSDPSDGLGNLLSPG